LSCARKNGKSGLIAALLLAHLAPEGPLRSANWRALVVSETGRLAAELRRQVQEIAQASGIDHVEVRAYPTPGQIIGLSGTCDILAADKATGHAAGVDLAIIDEAGLLAERQRSLWDAVTSAVSGRDGRVIGISIQSTGPMFAEALAREGQPGVHVVRYEAPMDAPLDDPETWHMANPGLETGIKSLEYMAHRARQAITQPSTAAGFRALDLNQPVHPEAEMLADMSHWEAVETADLPPREGRVFLGVDLGGSMSLTAAVALWDSGRLESWVAVPALPTLAERGQRDGVGSAYQLAAQAGWLQVLGHHVTDARAFLGMVLADISAPPTVIGCDRYRQAELREVLAGMDLAPVPVKYRGVGASATADGSYDVRAFQRAVAERSIRCRPNPMMRMALGATSIRRDSSGNPALDKSRYDSRIDMASAAVIACGLRALAREETAERRPSFVIAG